MIQFKLNNEPIQMPSSWLDLTYGHYLGILENKGGILELISLFTGIDIDTLKKAEIEGLESIIETLSFLKETPEFPASTPRIGKYELPLNSKGEYNIQFESLGQFEDMRAVMSKVPNNNALEYTKALGRYVSIYLQKIRDCKYDPDKALFMFDSEVFDMPAHEVIAAGSFFLLRLLSLLNGTQKASLNILRNQKKNKLDSEDSARPSDL